MIFVSLYYHDSIISKNQLIYDIVEIFAEFISCFTDLSALFESERAYHLLALTVARSDKTQQCVRTRFAT